MNVYPVQPVSFKGAWYPMELRIDQGEVYGGWSAAGEPQERYIAYCAPNVIPMMMIMKAFEPSRPEMTFGTAALWQDSHSGPMTKIIVGPECLRTTATGITSAVHELETERFYLDRTPAAVDEAFGPGAWELFTKSIAYI